MVEVAMLPTPLGRRVKVVEQGAGTPVVFLHSGVGSAGEWKQVFALWPAGYRLVAVDAYGGDTLPAAGWSLDDFVDHVLAVVRSRVAHAQHTLVDGGGHMLPLTHPEQVTRALLAGISR